jgi:hypothetical protein
MSILFAKLLSCNGKNKYRASIDDRQHRPTIGEKFNGLIGLKSLPPYYLEHAPLGFGRVILHKPKDVTRFF